MASSPLFNLTNFLTMPFKSMMASIGTGLVNNALSQENASVQRDWQEKMWRMQNAYNHPSAMADRMRSAGLNPYMMQGAEPAGSVGTGATAQTIPLDNPLAYAKTFAEIDNLTASTYKTNTEAEKLLKDMSMLDLMYSRGLLEKEEYEFKMKKYFEAWEEKNPFALEAENTEADTGLKKAQTETEDAKQTNLGADSALKEAQTETEDVKQANLGVDTELKKSQKLLTDLQQITEESRNTNIVFDTGLKSKQQLSEIARARALKLENDLTEYFGPMEHWKNIDLMTAQYDKLASEIDKIEADRIMLSVYTELELLKLEYQDLWVDKKINSEERMALLKNITTLSDTLITIVGKSKKD